MLPKAKLAAVLAMDEVVMGVRDAAIRVGSTGSLPADGQAPVKMAKPRAMDPRRPGTPTYTTRGTSDDSRSPRAPHPPV